MNIQEKKYFLKLQDYKRLLGMFLQKIKRWVEWDYKADYRLSIFGSL